MNRSCDNKLLQTIKISFAFVYKLGKTVVWLQTIEQAEQNKIFPESTVPADRLREAWYLTCMAHGIDPENSPKMEKSFVTVRKHEK